MHYVGQLQDRGGLRHTLEGLGVGGQFEFVELNPNDFNNIVFEDETIDIPCGEKKFQARLKERLPAERDGIEPILP